MQVKTIVIASAIFLSSFNFAVVASAQESKTLVDVLNTAASSELNGTVQVTEVKAENPTGAKLVLKGGGQDTGALFTESMQVNLNNGAMSACTTELPMIKIFRDGDKQLNSVTFLEKPVFVDTTADAILRAIDFKTLIEEVEGADEVSEKEVDGKKQYTVMLNRDYFTPKKKEGEVDPLMALRAKMMSESVLEGKLIATVNSGGQLETLTLDAQYNDPLSVIAKAMKNGGGQKAISPEDLANDDTPGRKVTVEFTVTNEDNAESKAFATEAAKMLSE